MLELERPCGQTHQRPPSFPREIVWRASCALCHKSWPRRIWNTLLIWRADSCTRIILVLRWEVLGPTRQTGLWRGLSGRRASLNLRIAAASDTEESLAGPALQRAGS